MLRHPGPSRPPRRRAVTSREPEDHETDAPLDRRGLVRAALPLLVVGAVAFAGAYIFSHGTSRLGVGHVPLWGLFAAIGVVVSGGGVTVLLAGQASDETAEPFYDPRDYVLLRRDEYAELVSDRPHEPMVAVPARVPTWSETEDDLETEPSPPEEPPARTRPAIEPSPVFTAKVDEAIDEMEQLLGELREQRRVEGRVDAPDPVLTPAPAPPAPVIVRSPPPAPPPSPSASPRPRAAAAAIPAVAPPRESPARPSTAVAPALRATGPSPAQPKVQVSAGICSSCGRRVAVSSRTHKCTVCGGPICSDCVVRARKDGHPEVCTVCAQLLPKSDRDDA